MKKFLMFGLVGLLVECWFTGVKSWFRGDGHGTCQSWLSMVPVYGSAGLLLEGLRAWMSSPSWAVFPVYVLTIYLCEFGWGLAYAAWFGRCPWRYQEDRWTVMGLVNLRYWPYWAGLAILFDPISRGLHVVAGLLVF